MGDFSNPDAAVPLSLGSLDALETSIKRPQYARGNLSPGIVHIGVGNFHRAHQGFFLHRLMQMGEALDWAIVGAGVRPADAAMRQKLANQDYLTTLIELDPQGQQAEITGGMIDFLPVEPDNHSLVQKMAEPAIRIVAMTVTEGGYYQDPQSGQFDPNHPDIQHDAQNPRAPKTAFGAIVAALSLRQKSGVGPFTAMSCDNLQSNGDILRHTIIELAKLSDPNLAQWIAENVSFPNSMVDCIVPATGPKELARAKSYGIADAAPVTHENFRQWVIEDKFCAGRPALEKVGVEFSDEVHAFESMKLRLLNGGHQVIANAAELLDIPTIDQAMQHTELSQFFHRVLEKEIAPFVEPPKTKSVEDYIDLISKRFSNTAVADTTRRVAFDGSSRHTGFVIPSIIDGLNSNSDTTGLALVEALWARMCEGTRENESIIEPNDPRWEELTIRAKQARHDPLIWLDMDILDPKLKESKTFADAFKTWLDMLWEDGVEHALKSYLG